MGRENGYILPVTIIFGLALSIMSIVYTQSIVSSSVTLDSKSYTTMAQEAANAGAAFANSCVSTNVTYWTSLTPATNCSGGASGSNNYTYSSSDLRSYFSVSTPNATPSNLKAISTGTVEILSGSTVVKKYTAITNVTLPASATDTPKATGNVITDFKSNRTDCAIANGKLYCWGSNDYYQLADGTTTARATPTLIGGALTGKTVSQVSVGDENVCAIADGLAYCWGRNTHYQIGDSTTTTRTTPTAIPGVLAGKLVSDISVSPSISVITLGGASYQNTCAVASGTAYCWGDNSKGQDAEYNRVCTLSVFGVCIIWTTYQTDTLTTPSYVYGYDSGDSSAVLYQKKADRIGAGSHLGCLTTQGNAYCWGKVSTFGGVNEPFALANDFSGKAIDPKSFAMSDNEMCAMANTDFVCYGASSAFSGSGVQPPTTQVSGANVTMNDSGEDLTTGFGTGTGRHCWINSGVAYCYGTDNTGTNYTTSIKPLLTSSGLANKIPTQIAAGVSHGCVVANGQLLCWGNGTSGRLADGNTANHTVNNATISGNGVIGTTDGTKAANGPISVGGSHSCGEVNGKVYCWGRNTYGQLGTGNNTDQSKPTSLTLAPGVYASKVSVGTSHSCAVGGGSLYCWGRNNNGQIGVGLSAATYNAPQLVGGLLAGKRVTDVEAGDTGTCAIANGQAFCWGLNTYGQVGDGTAVQRSSPVLISSAGYNVTAISMGTDHACAVANGDGYCWGRNDHGQLGINSLVNQSTPVKLTLGTAGAPLATNGMSPYVSSVSAGNGFSCAIINSTTSCWGYNLNGRTGLNTTAATNTLIPTALSGAAGSYYATAISSGDSHACAVLNGNSSATNGNLFCWGAGGSGRIGDGGNTDRATAVVVNGGNISGKSTINVSAGGSSTCSISNGNILCWGYGIDGQVGDGTSTSRLTPVLTGDYASSSTTYSTPNAVIY